MSRGNDAAHSTAGRGVLARNVFGSDRYRAYKGRRVPQHGAISVLAGALTGTRGVPDVVDLRSGADSEFAAAEAIDEV